VADQSKPEVPSHEQPAAAPGDPLARMLFLQRTAGNQALAGIRQAVRAPGLPLDPATRAHMEAAFGRDLSQVRVHTDDDAAGSAAAVRAEAYTVGQDVVFGDGQYAPGTTGGRRLLAHELAHTIQQRDGAGPPPSNDPDGIHERSARDAADDVAANTPAQAPMPSAGVGVSMNAVPERELAIKEAEAELARMAREEAEEEAQEKREAEAEAKAAARSYGPTTLSLIQPDPNQMTDEMIEAPLKEFRDREKAQKQKKQIVEEALDETRDERFGMFRQVLTQHPTGGDALAAFMSKNLPMRDLQVLRRYGLEWPHWYNRHKFLGRVKGALDRYAADQHHMRYGDAPVAKEFTQEDEEALRKQQFRDEFDKAWVEGLEHVTGSVSGGFGAWLTSQFTDDPKKITAGAKLGTAVSGSYGSVLSTVAHAGSYVPEVEGPASPTGSWRYRNPAPIKDADIVKKTPAAETPAAATQATREFPKVDLSKPFQSPVELPAAVPKASASTQANASTAAKGRTAAPDDVLAGFIERLGASEHPFTLNIGEKRAQKIQTGEKDFTLDAPIAFDVDEPLAVGAEGLKPQRAVDRARDPHNRQLLDPQTNRTTKHLRENPGDVARHRQKLDEVSLLDDPNAVFTRRFDEVTELHAVFRQAEARVRNPGSLRPTGLKNAINKNIREIIRDGSTPEGRIVRETLQRLGFEYVENRGFVAVSR
jgi:hypothetical protein